MQIELKDIIALLGGSTVIATAIATFVSNLIIKKLNNQWTSKSQIELEKVKAAFEGDRIKLNTLISSSNQLHAQSHETRINGIKKLWEKIFEIREINEHPVFFYTILLPSEYNEFSRKNDLQEFTNKSRNLGKLSRDIFNISLEVEKNRPFLSEKLWGLFSVYLSLSGRLAFQLYDGFLNSNIKEWYKDDGILQFLKVLFSETELTEIDYSSPITLKNIIWKIEEKILKECTNIISGELITKENIRMSEQIHKLLTEYSVGNAINKTKKEKSFNIK